MVAAVEAFNRPDGCNFSCFATDFSRDAKVKRGKSHIIGHAFFVVRRERAKTANGRQSLPAQRWHVLSRGRVADRMKVEKRRGDPFAERVFTACVARG